MQILHENAREGKIRLRTESADDLWELSHIISEGDLIRASTERKIQMGDDRSKQIRKKLTLTIAAETIDFEHGTLRINGPIQEGPEDLVSHGDYHGISIEEHQEITITKEWDTLTYERLQRAAKEKPRSVLIVIFDREQALFAQVKRQGVSITQHLTGEVAKKQLGGGSENFWQTIARAIELDNTHNNYTSIVVGTSTFWKDEVLKILPEEITKKTITTTITTVSESSIKDILGRSELETALQNDRAAQEERHINAVLEAIGKDQATYGAEQVLEAATNGRLSLLLVSMNYVEKTKENETYEQVDALLEQAKSTGATVHLIEHQVQQLDALGGLAGVLRW